MDHLWSPWRLEYVTGATPATTGKPGCVFCRPAPAEGAPTPAADPLLLFDGQTCSVVLNLYPYNNGHLLVIPHRHEATLAGLTTAEMNELGLLIRRSEMALRQAYSLEGINVGVNLGRTAGAGIVEHVHVHLVPRWHGDTNFMTVVGETRVLPESLDSAAARLRPIFETLAR